jgi:hypothetical protein
MALPPRPHGEVGWGTTLQEESMIPEQTQQRRQDALRELGRV